MTRCKTSLLRTLSLALLVIGLSGIAQAQTRAYVAQFRAHQVSVIDTATNTVVATIPVGAQPRSVILSPDGSRAYVTDLGPTGSTIHVIDTATNTVVASIPAPHAFLYMAFSPDGSRLYVSDRLFTGTGVSVIDTSTNSIVASIATPGLLPNGLAVTPDGAHLYIAARYTGDILIADTTTNAVVDAISDPTVLYTEGLALSPDGSRLYAGSTTGFRTIDTATKTELALSQPGEVNISVSPDGTKAYLCGAAVDSGEFWVDDTATNTVTAQGLLNDFHGAWVQTAFTPDSAYAYVSDYHQGRVVVFDTTSNAAVAEISLGYQTGVWGIAIGTLPPTTPFASFNVSKLQSNSQGVSEAGSFTLGSTSAQTAASAASTGIDPVTQTVTYTIGSYILDVPAGTFRKNGANLHWKYEGTLNGVKLNLSIKQHGQSTTQFDYTLEAKDGPVLTGQPRPIRVGLKIGRNTGSALVP